MPKNFGRWGGMSNSNKRVWREEGKMPCAVCGRPKDVFHDNEACAKKWLADQDAKGNPSALRGGEK